MKIVDVEQGSKEWLSLRKSKITATDSGSIMGLNPFKDGFQIYLEKLDLKPSDKPNSKMLRGQALEPEARNKLCELTGLKFQPIVCISSKVDFMMASLDGISIDTQILCEIKCPSSLKKHQEHLEGIIAPYYFSQMQHQMFCSGANKCYFFSYYPSSITPTSIKMVDRDDEFIEDLKEKCGNFYYNHLTAFKPPLTEYVRSE